MKGPSSLPKSLCIVPLNNSKKVASAKVNIFYSDIPVPGVVPGCPRTEGQAAHVLSLAGSRALNRGGSSSGPSEALDPTALAGVPVLLVAHEGPVVAQDVHGVLPVPAGAAVVLEAGLQSEWPRVTGVNTPGPQVRQSTKPAFITSLHRQTDHKCFVLETVQPLTGFPFISFSKHSFKR